MTGGVSALVQVTSFHPGPSGGGVLLGREAACAATPLIRAIVPHRVLPRAPVPGETWRVTGVLERLPVTDPATGWEGLQDHVVAAWAAPTTPRGAALQRWIARHPGIAGVGEGYAERLWDAYGPRLYDVIRAGDVAALALVLDAPKASAIVDAFGVLLDEVSALEDLDEMGLDGRTAHAAVRLFGTDAGRRFRENPYALTLLEPWRRVDAAALAGGMHPTDPRRLLAAVDVAASMEFRTTESNLGGHTVLRRAGLLARVGAMLGRAAGDHAGHAVAQALAEGALAEVEPELYQARAPAHMERAIERSVVERLSRPRVPMDVAVVDAVLSEVEAEDGIKFEPEQRAAVFAALGSGVAMVEGGAGSGKSTVVKAIMRCHRRGRRGGYTQVALSGRAAKRLREATGVPAFTIHRYLRDTEYGRTEPGCTLLVVDEFSMVSTPDLWLLLDATAPGADVLLVGDSGQLPPIRAGNPAAAFSVSRLVPRVGLRRVHRQASETGIPRVAEAIRAGQLLDLPAFDPNRPDRPGVFLWFAAQAQVPKCVLGAFEALVGSPASDTDPDALSKLHARDVQVLAMTRKGAAGTEAIGEEIERRWMTSQPTIHDWGLRVGSKVLWVKNSYEHRTGRTDADGRDEMIDLMNGTLGVVRRPTRGGADVEFDDGTVSEIRRDDLGRLLRGWAISVHRAQGSAFRRVIVPVVPSRLLDRAMLYTAVTRATDTVVLIGDPLLAARAIAAVPRAWRRLQALDLDRAIARQAAQDVEQPYIGGVT